MKLDLKNMGLVLEGGGMRGVFTCGVLDYFMDHHIEFPYGIGVSAGACNGLSYMSHQRGRAKYSNIDMMAKYHEYLMTASGRTVDNQVVNTTWATMDGISWALMASGDANFTKREGAMITNYDDKFFLIGGIDASNKALKDMYQSIDYGISWSLIDSMVVLPTDYAARGFSSIIVDKENFVNIFGGKTSTGSNDLNQLWRGRINRLIPKE